MEKHSWIQRIYKSPTMDENYPLVLVKQSNLDTYILLLKCFYFKGLFSQMIYLGFIF